MESVKLYFFLFIFLFKENLIHGNKGIDSLCLDHLVSIWKYAWLLQRPKFVMSPRVVETTLPFWLLQPPNKPVTPDSSFLTRSKTGFKNLVTRLTTSFTLKWPHNNWFSTASSCLVKFVHLLPNSVFPRRGVFDFNAFNTVCKALTHDSLSPVFPALTILPWHSTNMVCNCWALNEWKFTNVINLQIKGAWNWFRASKLTYRQWHRQRYRYRYR